MQITSNILTPDTLRMLEAIAQAGSFAGAARQLGLVPSALTYRVRQIEDALDVLLFDRSTRQARLTEAGHEVEWPVLRRDEVRHPPRRQDPGEEEECAHRGPRWCIAPLPNGRAVRLTTSPGTSAR